jgi:enoyl-CoA hydratase/carnithine racemase
MFETILYVVSDGILTITLNRPDRLNAFTTQMMTDLIAAFDRADADDAVRAIVVTGAGRAFCAGADLSEGAASFDYGAQGLGSAVRADGSVDYAHDLMRDTGGRLALRIFACLKPVIGAFNGAAVGVGATFPLAMDVRLASETARFGYVFARRGIVNEGASSWFLPRIVCLPQALEWSLSGRIFGAAEAKAGGLVRSVHAPDDLLPAAYALAREFADGTAPVSVAMIRQMLWRMAGEAHPMVAHRLDSRLVFDRGRSGDAAEGVASFLEKRPAKFAERVSQDLPPSYPWWVELAYD